MTYGVITACFNSAATIRRTIKSVLEQTVPPDEYIFVDGGSTDDTLQLIDRTIDSAKSDNASIKFKVLCQSSNNGIYGALNMGIGALEADVVFILHSDDWYEPKAAENVISVFDKNPEADIVIGRAMFYKNGRDASPVLKNNRSFSLFPVLHPVIHPACFVKRDVYGRIGNFNENYLVSADYDFTYRCYKSGINFLKCHEHLVNVQKGGFGWKNKNIAMCENLRIGLKHGRNNIFPKLAYLLRVLLNR